MTPQELKNSILQLAIQGKLVEQRPEEGTGEELYKQIQEEKQKLIKEGKIKKEKYLPEITADEIPFDIPEGWKWVRVRDCCIDVFNGKSPVYEKNETQYRVVGQAANQQNGLDFSQVKYTNESFWTKMNSRYFLQENDVLLNTLGNGTLGRSGIVTKLPFPLLTDGHLFVFRLNDEVQSKYFYYYLQLRRTEIEKNANGSTNQTFLSLGKTMSWIVPLPPLAEQKRIVAKIEALLPYIDRYEKAWSRLEDLNKRFPVDMQKSILQMAIQGKLVEQRPEEGTAEELYKQIQSEKKELIKAGKIKKEKPLPEITEDEIPFDIPESWKWVRMGNFAQLVTKGSSPRWQGIQYVEEGLLFVTSENVGINSLILENKKYVEERFNELSPRSQLSKGDLLTNIVGASIGRTAVYNLDEPANINQAVCLIRLVNSDLLQYILMYMNSATAYNIMMSDKVDTARANISLTNISNFIIPIPPLAEQKRIIAKLAEILPLCRNLK